MFNRFLKGTAATAIMLLLVLLAACGGANSPGESTGKPSGQAEPSATAVPTANAKADADYKGEFTLWSWDTDHKTLAEAFQQKYPNIKMNAVFLDSEFNQKLQATIASGGELPDVIRIEGGAKATIFEWDILEDLEQAPYQADIRLLFDYDAEPYRYNGKLVAIPEDSGVAGLAYIKKTAAEYLGTDNPEELEKMLPDWDAVIAKGKEVLAQSEGKVKMFASLGEVYVIVNGQRSGPYFDGDVLHSSVVKEVVAQLVKIRDAGIVDKLEQWSPSWNAAFAGDNHLFHPSPVWFPQYVIGPNDPAVGRWGLMASPGGGFIWGGSSHGILKNAKNKELAWKWVEFESMSQEGAAALKVDGVFTHYKPAYADPAFTKWNWPNFGDQDIGKKFFVDISGNVNSVTENSNGFILEGVMQIIVPTLAKDSAFGTEQAMQKIVEELKAKKSTITVD